MKDYAQQARNYVLVILPGALLNIGKVLKQCCFASGTKCFTIWIQRIYPDSLIEACRGRYAQIWSLKEPPEVRMLISSDTETNPAAGSMESTRRFSSFLSMKKQHAKTCFFLLSLTLFCLGPVYHATAQSAIQCHCFTYRTYNPAEKFAADSYILATSFNSLLTRLAALPKRQIVMIKMKEGMAQDDLLISLKIAKTTGQELQKVLDLRRQNYNWAEIIAGLPLQKTVNKDEILGAIRAGASTEVAATRVADESIALFFGTPEEEIRKLRMSGLNEKEITLTLLLNHVSEIQPEALVEQYKDKGKSWSEIAYNLGVEPKAAGKLILAYPAKKIPENN